MADAEKIIKNSIARKITRRAMLLLLAAMVILFFGAYHLVSHIVMNESKDYAKTLLDIYADLLIRHSSDSGKDLSAENGEELIRISDLFCERSDVDFVFLFSVDEEEGTLIYSVTSFSSSTEYMDPGGHMIGYKRYYVLTPEERSVWKMETESISYSFKNTYGYEITTLKAIRDCRGNVFIAGIDLSYDQVYRKIINAFLLVAAAITAVLLAFGAALYLFLARKVSKPARKISRTMQDFISNGRRSDVRLDDSGTDEYAVIAGAFNSMSDDISQYVDDIKTLSAQQAGQQAELKIAEAIQRGFLSQPSAEFGSCSLRAVMNPAKDIGGDLYDYIRLDDRRVFIAIADVSGKGISAAMFMSVTLTLLRQFAKLGLSPDEILRQTNDALAEKNSELLFATAFVGIYDSGSGSLTYSNAGHNLPYLVGSTVRALDGAAGTVLGLYEGETYGNRTVAVSPGDTVFLYTDGVTEAVNTERRFFGEDRLEQVLAGFKESSGQDLTDAVYRAVCAYSRDAEQHDDITMLALHIAGGAPAGPESITLRLDCNVEEFVRIKEAILALPIGHELQMKLCLAAEEVFVNICSYAFADGAPEGEKVIFTLESGEDITLRFSDGGAPFNPLEDIAVPDSDDDPEIGGLGRFLYLSLCDDAKYEYNNGQNCLTLIKRITEAP